ncbi:Hypothetical predicted protein [Cloeon dipterum]|uniref:Uncharacterized protein n=1 Tax=Cloeon dipterum TaxID=197152 RepID=A0A8S1BKK0_9INSE|nr:Hypothetical predicted protein [Cloeon dipterum]
MIVVIAIYFPPPFNYLSSIIPQQKLTHSQRCENDNGRRSEKHLLHSPSSFISGGRRSSGGNCYNVLQESYFVSTKLFPHFKFCPLRSPRGACFFSG